LEHFGSTGESWLQQENTPRRVSAAAAAADYGVVMAGTCANANANATATAALRADRPAAKEFHRGEYLDAL